MATAYIARPVIDGQPCGQWVPAFGFKPVRMVNSHARHCPTCGRRIPFRRPCANCGGASC